MAKTKKGNGNGVNVRILC